MLLILLHVASLAAGVPGVHESCVCPPLHVRCPVDAHAPVPHVVPVTT